MTITQEKPADFIDIAPSWRDVIGECVSALSLPVDRPERKAAIRILNAAGDWCDHSEFVAPTPAEFLPIVFANQGR